MIRVSVTATLAALLIGCADKYTEGHEAGYQSGYRQGFDDANKQATAACEERLRRERRECSEASSPTYSSTEVCGGGGVNVSGKHYPPGKTGCVRVHSDGRIERY